ISRRNRRSPSMSMAIVKSDGLNVHDKPHGKIIDAIKKGDRVRVDDSVAMNGWMKVTYNFGNTAYAGGWVDSRFIDIDKPKPPPAPFDDDFWSDGPLQPKVKDDPSLFWVICGFIVLVAVLIWAVWR